MSFIHDCFGLVILSFNLISRFKVLSQKYMDSILEHCLSLTKLTIIVSLNSLIRWFFFYISGLSIGQFVFIKFSWKPV